MKKCLSLTFILMFLLSFGQTNNYLRDSINEAFRNKFILERNEKYGLKDSLGNLKTRIEFDDISIFDTKYFLVRKDTLYGVYGRNGKNIIPVNYREIYNVLPNSRDYQIAYYSSDKFWYAYKYNPNINHDTFGIFSKNGEKKYPEKISYNRGTYELNNMRFAIVSIVDDQNFIYYEDKKINAYKDVLLKFNNNDISEYELPFEYKHLQFLEIQGNKIVVYTSPNGLTGFFDLKSNRKIEPRFKSYIFNENKIFAREREFYTTEIDKNLNFRERNENIIAVLKEFEIIKYNENMSVLKGNTQANFSFPLIDFQEFKDEQIPVLFKYYLDKDQTEKKYSQPGIISFDGKINIKPSKEGSTSFNLINGGYHILDQTENNKNKKNEVFLVKEWRSISPKSDSIEITFYNREGNEIMHFDRDLYDKYLRNCSRQSITIKDNLLFSNCYKHPDQYFFVYNLTSKKFIFKDKKGMFQPENDGKYKITNYNKESKQTTDEFYSKELNFLYKIINKSQ